MTFQEFMTKFNLKNSATVRNWIEKGYIPGADYEANFIPDRSLPPFTNARAKKPGAIYVSIIKGLLDGFRPIPEMYPTINREEFYNVYLRALIRSGYVLETQDESISVTFYYPSEKAQQYYYENERNLIKRLISDFKTIGIVIGNGRDFIFRFLPD